MAQSETDARGREIKKLVEEMKLYNNPQELEDLKKVLKKNVPLSMRGYLLAYLYVTSKHSNAKPVRETRQPDPNSAALYINVGRMSKAPAKELAEFVCTTAHISNSDIVSIAYKQNYSFIYLKKELAQSVIDAVNGQTYKGRKVKINFSKEKDEQ